MTLTDVDCNNLVCINKSVDYSSFQMIPLKTHPGSVKPFRTVHEANSSQF